MGLQTASQINRAIAVGNQKGPEAGLKALEEIGQIDITDQYFLFHATKADLHFRLNHFELARSYYRVSLDLTDSKLDRHFFKKKIKECDRKNITKN